VGGGDVTEGQLTIVGIDISGTGIAVTPPTPSAGHPVWNQIGTTTSPSSNIEEVLYWHELGSAETGSLVGFTFGLGSSVRASIATVTYTNTCLDDATCPSGNPIDDFSVDGVSTSSGSVTTTRAINVPSAGEAVAVFGTSNTTTAFGIGGGTVSGGLNQVTGDDNQNGGIEIFEKFETTTGTDGPFTATMESPAIGDNVAQVISIFPE